MNSGDNSQHPPLSGISSMATSQLLAEVARVHALAGGTPLALESVGGVDAEWRVQADEPFDLDFLAADAIAKLANSAHVIKDSRVDLVRSQVAVAVKVGAPTPSIATEADVRQAVISAA